MARNSVYENDIDDLRARVEMCRLSKASVEYDLTQVLQLSEEAYQLQLAVLKLEAAQTQTHKDASTSPYMTLEQCDMYDRYVTYHNAAREYRGKAAEHTKDKRKRFVKLAKKFENQANALFALLP